MGGCLKFIDPIAHRIGYSLFSTLSECLFMLCYSLFSMTNTILTENVFTTRTLKMLPEESQTKLILFFWKLNYLYIPFCIIFGSLGPLIPCLALIYPAETTLIFRIYLIAATIIIILTTSTCVATGIAILQQLGNFIFHSKLDRQSDNWKTMFKVYLKMKANTITVCCINFFMGVITLIPAFWPFLLRKGSYIVPIINVLASLYMIVTDVMALYNSGKLFPDINPIVQVLKRSVVITVSKSKNNLNHHSHSNYVVPEADEIIFTSNETPKRPPYSCDVEQAVAPAEANQNIRQRPLVYSCDIEAPLMSANNNLYNAKQNTLNSSHNYNENDDDMAEIKPEDGYDNGGRTLHDAYKININNTKATNNLEIINEDEEG
jgi:hypothetical protein